MNTYLAQEVCASPYPTPSKDQQELNYADPSVGWLGVHRPTAEVVESVWS